MSRLRDEILRVCEEHCQRSGISLDALSRRALGGDHHAITNLRRGRATLRRLERLLDYVAKEERRRVASRSEV